MTKKRLWLPMALSAALVAPAVLNAQDPAPAADYGIKFGGFVKFDAFNDTRQVVAARDDMFLLYPAARSQITAAPGAGATTLQAIPDTQARQWYPFADNTDLNALGQTGMTAVQSRLTGKITGPDAWGAKVTGLLEIDFFGHANYTTNMARLRHAYVNLDWGKTSVMVGQNWHPLFLQGGIFPGTLQFNPLAPIHPFGRAPQMALTLKPVDGLRISFYALEQSYHSDSDPNQNATLTTIGNPSGKALRNAKIPELAVQADYKVGGLTIGGTYDRKTIVPLNPNGAVDSTYTNATIGNNTNGVTTKIYQAFVQLKQGDLTIKGSTTWGDNWFALLGVGGYSVKESTLSKNARQLLVANGVPQAEALQGLQTLTAFTKKEYAPTQARGYWAEIAYGKELEFAVVGGKVVNLGASEEIETLTAANTVGRNALNLKEVITIAPRIKMTSGKTVFGIEYIYSQARYMEDDKNFQAAINDVLNDSRLDGVGYTVNTGYLSLQNSDGATFANDDVRNKNGRIGATYAVVNHRIQVSVQQNF